MVFSIQPRKDKKQHLIDVREAFNLWDLLNSKYSAIENFQLLINLTHDPELKIIIEPILEKKEKIARDVEKYLKKYSIASPDKARKYVNYPTNSQFVTDEFIGDQLLICIQEELENLIRGFRTSTTNDEVRSFFKKLAKARVDDLNIVVKYLKLKGWLETPPLYNRTPPNIKEKITAAEVANIWDHLTYRYDNLYITELMKRHAFDGDFKLMLDTGLRVLRKQVTLLEKELSYFGIPMPNAPGDVTLLPENTEIVRDEQIFRMMLEGQQGAAILHIQPLKECTFNDRVRNIFKKLLFEELDMIDNIYKYAKTKGWLNPIPLYGA